VLLAPKSVVEQIDDIDLLNHLGESTRRQPVAWIP
jgi:hypothetical protein